MKIAACVKLVPATTADIRVASSGDRLELSGLETDISAYDGYALEEALKLREKIAGSTLTVITVGGDDASKALHHAFTLGADEGLLLKGFGDPAAAAAAALKSAGAEIVFCGRQAVDDDLGCLPASVAEALGWPHVSAIMAFALSADSKSATVRRRVEGGEETWEVALPAVFSCDKGLNDPRFATLKGRLAAKSKKAKVLGPKELGIDAGVEGLKAISYKPPPGRAAGKVLEGEKEQVVAELARLLKDEKKVL